MTTSCHRWPNLFIVGAMKCGTTSLHAYLSEHPQICMSSVKEPSFFVRDDQEACDRAGYLSLFDAADDGTRYLGESSTDYTKLPFYPGVSERIQARSPNARIIYLVRHPLERIVSHYWYDRQHATVPSDLGMLERVQADPQFLEFTRYAHQIQPYIERFGRENVLILVLEEMQRDMWFHLRRIFDWLDVYQDVEVPSLEQRHNVKPDTALVPRGLGALYRLRRTAAWSSIAPVVPKPLRAVVARVSIKRLSTEDDEQREQLRIATKDFVHEQIDDLSKLMSRDLSTVWPTSEYG